MNCFFPDTFVFTRLLSCRCVWLITQGLPARLKVAELTAALTVRSDQARVRFSPATVCLITCHTLHLCETQAEQQARTVEVQDAKRRLVLADQVSSDRLKKIRLVELESCRRADEIAALRRDRAQLEQSVRESTRMVTSTMTLMGELQLELSSVHAMAAASRTTPAAAAAAAAVLATATPAIAPPLAPLPVAAPAVPGSDDSTAVVSALKQRVKALEDQLAATAQPVVGASAGVPRTASVRNMVSAAAGECSMAVFPANDSSQSLVQGLVVKRWTTGVHCCARVLTCACVHAAACGPCC